MFDCCVNSIYSKCIILCPIGCYADRIQNCLGAIKEDYIESRSRTRTKTSSPNTQTPFAFIVHRLYYASVRRCNGCSSSITSEWDEYCIQKCCCGNTGPCVWIAVERSSRISRATNHLAQQTLIRLSNERTISCVRSKIVVLTVFTSEQYDSPPPIRHPSIVINACSQQWHIDLYDIDYVLSHASNSQTFQWFVRC